MLRMLQVPELMRAMGFGDDYVLDSVRQRRDRIRILGNGVAPPVMQAIVQTLTETNDSRRLALSRNEQRTR
jgi:DNA (cytosine-5)-methyltransferase 1